MTMDKQKTTGSLNKVNSAALAAAIIALLVSASLVAFNISSTQPSAPYTFMIYPDPVVAGQYDAKAANGTIIWTSTNASAVANNAVGNTTSGGEVHFAHANYTFDVPLYVNQYAITISGDGANDTDAGTIFSLAYNANCSVIRVQTGTHVTLKDFFIEGNGAHQSGTSWGIAWSGAILHVNNVYVDHCLTGGMYLSGSVSFLYGCCSENNPIGYELASSYGYHKWSSLCAVTNSAVDYWFKNTNKAQLLESAINGGGIGADGIVVNGTSTEIVLDANILHNVGHNGIVINASHITVCNNQIYGASYSTNNGYDGIMLQNASTYDIIRGNNIHSSEVNKPQYCIEEQIGADYNSIEGNTVTDAVTTQIKRSGAKTSVHNNLGYNAAMSYLVTPTAVGWGIAPTDLAYACDGSFSTVTGTGNTNTSGVAYLGYLQWNLGATYNVILKVCVGLWSNTSSIGLSWQYSPDNVNWNATSAIQVISSTSTIEVLRYGQLEFAYARYIRLYFAAGALQAGYVKIYECSFIDLGIS